MRRLDKTTGSPPSLFIGFPDTFESNSKVGEKLGIETHDNGVGAVTCPIVDAARRIAAALRSSQGRALLPFPSYAR